MLKSAASLTIDYNGKMGVCPWEIGYDYFTETFNQNTFVEFMKAYFNTKLMHNCSYCSSIRVTNSA